MRPYAPEDMKIFEQRSTISLKCDKCGNEIVLQGKNTQADIAECAYFRGWRMQGTPNQMLCNFCTDDKR